MNAQAVVQVSDLSVGFAGKSVLSGINLSVGAGEVVAVLGPNGCGKSTLLRCVAGLHRPNIGAVYLNGQCVARIKPKQLACQLAFQAQDVGVALGYTVRTVVAMGRLAHRSFWRTDAQGDAEEVEHRMAQLEIAHLAERAVETLSGGERQRMGIARALVQGASVLVLDEPSNHLDVRHQFAVLDLVRQLGLTTLVTLHDLQLATRVADRVALLHEGRVVSVGPPAETLTPTLIRQVYQVGAVVSPLPSHRHLDIRLHPLHEEVSA